MYAIKGLLIVYNEIIVETLVQRCHTQSVTYNIYRVSIAST